MVRSVPLPGMPVGSSVNALTDAELSGLARRLYRRTVKTDGCWLWTGAISSPDGYGRISVRHDGEEMTLSCHRAAMIVAGAELLAGDVLEHHCNEPLCVRVADDHVHISTQSQNMAYAVSCGRAAGPRSVVGSDRRVERSRAVRDLARSGFDVGEYDRIARKFGGADRGDDDQLSLW